MGCIRNDGNTGIGGVVGVTGLSGSIGVNRLLMVYICAPYGSSGTTDKRLTIGKQYSVHENYGTGGRVNNLRYEFTDDFGIGMGLDAINFCTVGEWRSKQLDSILDEE